MGNLGAIIIPTSPAIVVGDLRSVSLHTILPHAIRNGTAVKSPYEVLFSNDTTNINSCSSPYSPKRTFVPRDTPGDYDYISPPFTEAMLEASVDETVDVGVDVHLLQPGVGWVPWWQSRVYPFEEHIEFMKEHTGMDPADNSFALYMANGGDMVAAFTRRCRAKGLAPFVSFRLNDSHGHEFLDMPQEEIPSWAWHVFCPTHVEHPEWRLSQDIKDWNGRVLNWSIPEVRAAKFAYIKEIIEQYDIDGFELDFLRHCNFFRQDETTSDERRGIITDFIGDVRAELDKRDCADGRHRWLCVRIPAQTKCFDPLGIDPAAMVSAGVEMLNLSNYYYTEHRGDFAQVRQMIGDDASIYFEMCHTVQQRRLPTKISYDCTLQRRATPIQFYTGAHLAYSRGCDGASTFNFVYYREHGVGERGPSTEPPFEIHRGIGDREFCARQTQHYVRSEGWGSMGRCPRPIPRTLRPGDHVAADIDMAPPAGGWTQPGRLRIQAEQDLGESQWTAKLNGSLLAETDDRSEPYENPYPQLLGTPELHRAWIVPVDLVRDGVNEVEVLLESSLDEARVVFLDLAIA